jgi:hypothetical protein
MRKLAAQDPLNPVWMEDLRTFEKARLRQIQHESSEAASRRDAYAISQLLKELDGQTWVEPPPQNLVRGLRKLDAQFRGQKTRAILSDLETQLNDAFAAFDVLRGRRLRDQWLAMVGSIKLSPGDPIHQRVEAALLWLEEQDLRDAADRQHESSIRALSKALDDLRRIGPRTLLNLGNVVMRHNRGMPDSVQKRFLEGLSSKRSEVIRKRTIIIGLSTAAVLMIVSVIGLEVRRRSRSNEADRVALAISDMIELEKLEQAGELLKKIRTTDAGLLEYPPMVDAQARYEVAQDKEDKRQLEFSEALRQAGLAPVWQLNPPALEKAGRLARLPTEKEAVENLVHRRKAEFQVVRQIRDAEIEPKLQSIKDRIARIERSLKLHHGDAKTLAGVEQALSETQRELSGLASGIQVASEVLQRLARELGQRLERLQSSVEHLCAIEREMTQLVQYTATEGRSPFTRYAGLLLKYAATPPDSSRAKAMEAASHELPAWETVAEWNHLVESWRKEPPGWSKQRIEDRLKGCASFLALHPELPDADIANEYKGHLEAIVKRYAGQNSLRVKLQELLSNDLVGSTWMVVVKELGSLRKRYYLSEKPKNGLRLIHFIVGFDGKKRTEPIVEDHIESCDLSPQSKIAARFKVILSQDNAVENWDKVMMDLASSIKDEASMDPLLKLDLLRKVVDLAGQGSVPLHRSLDAARSVLKDVDVDLTVCWMDPDNPVADRQRPGCEKYLKSLPDFNEVRRRANQRLDPLQYLRDRLSHTIGWLDHTQNGWQVKTVSTLPESGGLWVIVPKNGNNSVWKRVGRVVKSVPSITAAEGDVLMEGRPVFMRPEPGDRT